MLKRSWLLPAVVLGAAAVALGAARSSAHDTLRSAYFLSGWIALVPVAALAVAWWGGAHDGAGLARRVRRHLLGSAVLAALLALHVDLRVPNGGMEVVLAALFVALVVSTLAGAWLVGSAGAEAVPVRRWLVAHVALVHGLLQLALVHGLVSHFHGPLSKLAAGG